MMEATVIEILKMVTNSSATIIILKKKTPPKKGDQSLEIWVLETDYNGWR